MAKQTKIAANLAQNYTPSEQAQARQNIGLATVAHTGDFNDLVNKPTNITGQVQSNWTQDNVTAVDYIRNKPVIHTYTAGENVSISNDVISAVDTKYTAGTGLTLDGNEFSADTTVLQEKLTAGSNVQINDNVISATDTKYTAGTNVQINGSNVISATDTTYSAGSGITLTGTTFSADKTVMQEKLTAGTNVQINDNVISATDTKYTAGTNISINSSNVISATDTTYTAGTNVQINSSNVISATDTTYSAGSGLSLTGTMFSADKSVMQEKLTAGTNIQISNANVISATDTTYSAGTNISIDADNVISAASQVQSDWDATSGVAEILHKPETKFWYFDLNGVETTSWVTIGPTSTGATVHLPVQWDDQGTLGRVQVHTNFTQGDPEAFPISNESSRIILKKGLWRYTIYIDLEPTTLGTGVVDLSLWVRMMREGVANYITVRRIDMPTNNGVQSSYTRTTSGILYVDADPTYSGGELATYRSIHFDFDINGACDAVYRFRQNMIMLERIGV